MRALVIGASGLVGKRLLPTCRSRGVAAIGTGLRRPFNVDLALDIADRQAVINALAIHKPTVVFLSAAMAGVDYCEQHPDEARRANLEGVQIVADACAASGAALVFISTDYVFDGLRGPYLESDPTSPVSVYGRLKVEGERIALQVPRAMVVRTAVVYDWDPDSVNFAMQMIKRLSLGEPTKVVSDQWSHPTLARNLADVMVELAERGAQGVFHVVGADYISRYDFAVKLAHKLGFDASLLSPIVTADLHQPAKRPLQADLRAEGSRRLATTPLVGVDEGLELLRHDYEASKH